MEAQLLKLIETAINIGERYGVASVKNDTYRMNLLEDEIQIVMQEVRKLLKPTQLQQQAQQYGHQSMHMNYGVDVHKIMDILLERPSKEDKPDIEIEFSL